MDIRIGILGIYYLQVMPVTSVHEGTVQEHLFKVVVIFSVLLLPDSGVMKVGDARVLRVPTNIQDLAAGGEKLRRQHGELCSIERMFNGLIAPLFDDLVQASRGDL